MTTATTGRKARTCALCDQTRLVHDEALRIHPAVLHHRGRVVLVPRGEFACWRHPTVDETIAPMRRALEAGTAANPDGVRALIAELERRRDERLAGVGA
jgi:hypothetical protein